MAEALRDLEELEEQHLERSLGQVHWSSLPQTVDRTVVMLSVPAPAAPGRVRLRAGSTRRRLRASTTFGGVTSLYERVAGTPFFVELVDRFYAGVADDPVLRPLYREGDLVEERGWLTLFLVQYWGGPGTYSEHRGHPRLRQRHLPFAIGEPERDAWLGHMQAAVDASSAGAAERTELSNYFTSAADFLVNR